MSARPKLISTSGQSLRLRLAVAGLILLFATFAIAFFGLSFLFERHVERRASAELELHLDQIIASLRPGGNGALKLLRDPVDPRFSEPLSGLYWQVESDGRTIRSRSLWDQALDLPILEPGSPVAQKLKGPGGKPLLVVAREVIGGRELGNAPVLVAVALDRADIDKATADFRSDMVPYFLIFALLLVGANLAQVHVGLRPLSALRKRIADIRSGKAQRMGNEFPREILPLTDEVDGLLASREEQLQRARRQAADLAHGLKTPLQALAGDVERLRANQLEEIAQQIDLSIAAMRRHIDHQLARARMAERGQTNRTVLLPVIMRVLAVLERTPNGEMLDWNIDVASDTMARIEAEDLAELLGNILDNAARYANTSVDITAKADDQAVVLTVTDDGPGIPDDRLSHVIERGSRLDSSSGGAGLGLAISSEIIESTGGTLEIENAGPGLRVHIRLRTS